MDDNNNYLADEFIHNILKRLPIKSLIRFQCVCKKWKYTLKDPLFIPDQLKHSSHQPSLLPYQPFEHYKPFYLLTLDSNILQRRAIDNTSLIHWLSHIKIKYMWQFQIVGSINGLLCITIIPTNDLSPPSLLLWNPAINEIKEIPRINDDLLGCWYIGYGFSALANEYKIVRLHGSLVQNDHANWTFSEYITRAQVYSLSKKSWKDVELGPIDGAYVHPTRTNVSNNGVIFWVGETRNYIREEVIISFDIEREVFTVIKMPPIRCETISIPTIYDNKFALLQYHPKSEGCSSFNLWVIESNACPPGGKWSWIKKYSYEPINSHPYLLAPMNIRRNEIICRVEAVFGSTDDGYDQRTLCLLNPNTNEVKMFVMDIGLNFYDDLFNHVESLEPVRGRTLI